MTRAAAIFTLFVAMLAAGAVLAQSVTPVRAVRSQTVLAGRGPRAGRGERARRGIAAIEAAVGLEAKVALYPGRPILRQPARRAGAGRAQRRWSACPTCAARSASSPRAGRSTAPRAGEPVRVMNLASRQTVTGTVAADGSIEVGP